MTWVKKHTRLSARCRIEKAAITTFARPIEPHQHVLEEGTETAAVLFLGALAIAHVAA